MFTGIVEDIGTICGVRHGARSRVLEVSHSFDDLHLGDSVSVDGVCLTVSDLSRGKFTADVMDETLLRSTLGGLGVGNRVNMERALAVGGRFGGHIVSGHVDGTGSISIIKPSENAIMYHIAASSDVLRYIVKKGSVAIDGISLTVVYVNDTNLGVSVIPHTAKFTTLADKHVGSSVNLECDVLGKYVEKLLIRKPEPPRESINIDFLTKHGFGGRNGV